MLVLGSVNMCKPFQRLAIFWSNGTCHRRCKAFNDLENASMMEVHPQPPNTPNPKPFSSVSLLDMGGVEDLT